MIAARADFTIDGPGVTIHVHGDGTTLVADVRGDIRNARVIRRILELIRNGRAISRTLRRSGMCLDVRVGGRTVARFG